MCAMDIVDEKVKPMFRSTLGQNLIIGPTPSSPIIPIKWSHFEKPKISSFVLVAAQTLRSPK